MGHKRGSRCSWLLWGVTGRTKRVSKIFLYNFHAAPKKKVAREHNSLLRLRASLFYCLSTFLSLPKVFSRHFKWLYRNFIDIRFFMALCIHSVILSDLGLPSAMRLFYRSSTCWLAAASGSSSSKEYTNNCHGPNFSTVVSKHVSSSCFTSLLHHVKIFEMGTTCNTHNMRLITS